jgi:hypothetical protein
MARARGAVEQPVAADGALAIRRAAAEPGVSPTSRNAKQGDTLSAT